MIFLFQDSGGTLGSNNVIGSLLKDIQELPNIQNNCTAECMRPHFQDGVDFISDVHTLTKVKVNQFEIKLLLFHLVDIF